MSNTCPKTGIHYGVIAQNSLNQDVFSDVSNEAVDVRFDEYLETVKDDVRNLLEDKVRGSKLDDLTDEIFSIVEEAVSEDYQGEKTDWLFEDKDYKLTDCLETNVFVLKSPYFTFCKKCSPCVPNAGDLDNPEENGLKTYCLGPEFFDEDKAPYPVYVVKTGDLLEDAGKPFN